MKRILLVLTGGTIGSVDQQGIIRTSNKECRVLTLFREQTHEEVSFEVIRPLDILSENLEQSHWEIIVNSILAANLNDIDGIIITHGSDTLSYSSAMLAMCLNHIGLPVVITASNYVPDDPRSNALVNFTAAVSLIGMVSAGVYTVYKNDDMDGAGVFVPTRLCEADRITDRFSSIDGCPLGVICEDRFIRINSELSLTDLEKHRSLADLHELKLNKKVMLLRPYPSMSYENITLEDDVSAVLHVTYHSATVSENARVLLKKCRDKNIPVYMCSFKGNTASVYETSDKILRDGARPVYDTGVESAYAKLLLAVNLYPDRINEFMQETKYFERKGML